MRYGIIFFVFGVLLFGCRQPEGKTSVRFQVADYNGEPPRIEVGYLNQAVAIDSATGTGVLELDLRTPVYAEITVRKYDTRLCYLEPGKELTLAYSMKKGEKEVAFGGALGKEARFLNQGRFYAGVAVDFKNADIRRTARRVDSVITENRRRLADTDLSDTFKELESKRIQADAWMALFRGRVADTALYLQTLRETIREDSTYLVIPAYRDLLEQYTRRLVALENGSKSLEGTDLEDARMACVLKYMSDPAVVSYLVDKTLFHLGDRGIERYEEWYRQYVREPQRLAAYAEACEKADRIAPGQPCPDFAFRDNTGKTVTLDDLCGKFVYLDMWATWCGPCKGEMPSLLELEKRFEGEDILFVSLSIDRNKDIDLWKKTIQDMGLGGVQLHLGENWDWLKIFMPGSMSVPRFVLLDREGKIIDANMTRPSDKATAAKFCELLNIKNQ